MVFVLAIPFTVVLATVLVYAGLWGLAVVALLSRATATDFAFLRDHLKVSDSDLSKQMSALESAG